MNKTIRKIVSLLCLTLFVMSSVVIGVSAEEAVLDATVNLITSSVPSQDKLDITVNPDDNDQWITVTIVNEDGQPIEIFQEEVDETNNFVYSLSNVPGGNTLTVRVSTAPSNKVKDYTRKYYTFAQQQTAIDNIMAPDIEITPEIADVISLELEGDFGLLNSDGIAFLKQQLTTRFAGQETIDVQTFIDALYDNICLSILSCKDESIIRPYMEREKTELGIDTLTEYTWYDALSGDEKTNNIVSNLAKKTYPTLTDFVDAFKAENFLEKFKTVHSSTVISFITINGANQSNNGEPLNLNWTAYDNLEPGQKEYFAGLIAGVRYDDLTDFEEKFASKLEDAAEYVEEQEETTEDKTETTKPSPSLGTVMGGGFGGGMSGGPAVPPVVNPGSSNTFKDLDSVSWATEAINALYNKGVINGVDGENFDPEGIVSKEQFVKIIAGTFDIKATGEVKAFADVPSGQWYTEFINAAVENGIINGVSDTDFGLGTSISRQDMAVIVYRVAKKYGINLSAVRNDEPADISGVADYAKEAVTALYQAGVINGVGDGRFAPVDTATRAQAAKIIYELWRMM